MITGNVRVSVIALDDDPRSVGTARDWMRGLLDEVDTAPECVEQAVLITSELISNAVRHGSGDVLCHFVSNGSDRCLLTVTDFGGGTPGVVDRSVDDIGGLGLVIVDRLALAWGVSPFDGGKAVFAVLGTWPDSVDARR